MRGHKLVFCMGLTGNIGSGKSTVASYFADLGIPIISADKIAKDLTAAPQPAFQEIVRHFGARILTDQGEINRRHLRQLIFKNPVERTWLEEYLHPLIREQINAQLATIQSTYCMIEIPLLKNKSSFPYLNRVLLVEAESEQRIDRLTKRDQCSKEETLAILAIQSNQQTLRALADDIITNTGSFADLKEQVVQLHKKYLMYPHETFD